MKLTLVLTMAVLGLSLSGLIAQQVDNANFEKGKSGWLGDGKVVYINANDEISETPKPDFVPCLKVELSRNDWKEVKQTFRAKSTETDIQFSIKVKASPDFQRLPESKDYTKDIDFEEGGQYVWSALVSPKCDFLIRVQDSGWFYRPFSLSPAGTWKTFSADFPKLKASKRELALLLPPGTGFVYIKGS